ncbi:MAG: YcgR [Proteobacteria bacterium]|nr:YcgR [Pseudomonadota bacterium]
MTQIAQLSEAEIEARFRVMGTKPVAFLIAGFAKEREPFSVHFGAGGEMFLTTPLAVEPEKGLLIFDCSGSVESNQRFLLSDRNIFIGRPGGVHVQFTTGAAREVAYEGGKAFAVALPQYIVRLQRREYFRVETPRVNPLEFFGRMANGSLLKLPVHDISISGLGVDAAVLPEGVTPGVVLPNCHFSLPGDGKDMFFSATIRNTLELERRSGTRHWRIGMQFNDLSSGDETRIQRYIARIERERHELS